MKMQNNRGKGANIQSNPTDLEDNQIYYEIFNTNINSKDDEDIIDNNEDTLNKKSTNKENIKKKQKK